MLASLLVHHCLLLTPDHSNQSLPIISQSKTPFIAPGKSPIIFFITPPEEELEVYTAGFDLDDFVFPESSTAQKIVLNVNRPPAQGETQIYIAKYQTYNLADLADLSQNTRFPNPGTRQ